MNNKCITEKDYEFLLRFFEKYKKIESIRRFVDENSYFGFGEINVEQVMIDSLLSALNDENLLYMTKEQYDNYIMFHSIGKEIQYTHIINKDIISRKVIREYLYVNITMFKECVSEILFNELSKSKIDSYKGLIVDLRGNMGGIIEEAINIAKKMLDHKVITVIMQKNGKKTPIYSEKNYFNIPIILLVDKNTGSAAELLCAALMENKRAIVIGNQTYGKGTIQKVVKLNDGSGLKLTVAEFVSPFENKIEKVGINPTYTFFSTNIEGYISFIENFSKA